jgi:hypothetical protein
MLGNLNIISIIKQSMLKLKKKDTKMIQHKINECKDKSGTSSGLIRKCMII